MLQVRYERVSETPAERREENNGAGERREGKLSEVLVLGHQKHETPAKHRKEGGWGRSKGACINNKVQS